MKVFLTGITGFLGSHIAEGLHKQGHEIYALVRSKGTSRSAPTNIPFHPIEGSLPNCENLVSILSQVDAMIHVAGKVKALSQEEFEDTNAQGTQNLVKACLKANPKPKIFLYISSIAVFNPSLDGDDFCIPPEKCHPVSWYGASKLKGEKFLQSLEGKIRTLTLRPPVLYGPRDKELLPLFKSIKMGFAPLFGKGDNKLSLCFIKDVADCVVSLVERPPSQDEIFTLDDGVVYTWKSLALSVAKIMNKKTRTISIPPLLFKMGAFFTETFAKMRGKAHIFTGNKIKEMEQTNWVCGYQKLFQIQGWKPKTNFEEGSKITYDFYKTNHWL